MNFLEKLKSLFNIEINSPIISININHKSNNKSGSEYQYNPAEKTLELYIDSESLSQNKKREELQEILNEYIEEGNKLLESETSHLLKRLYKYNRENRNDSILKFFENIIPPADFSALEASLFIRDKFKAKEPVDKLKYDIRKRFGDRGNNISNLCTAGYFEEFFIPLYNASKDEFNRLYDVIVAKSVFAIFVHKTMPSKEIQLQISEKLKISQRYGIKFLHIHGIGKKNIEKITECIRKNKEFFDFFQKNIYESKENNIIIVELLFK